MIMCFPFTAILLRSTLLLLCTALYPEAIKAGEDKLGKSGRLVIRKSGTEPLIRVMGEGENATLVKTVVDDICAAV